MVEGISHSCDDYLTIHQVFGESLSDLVDIRYCRWGNPKRRKLISLSFVEVT